MSIERIGIGVEVHRALDCGEWNKAVHAVGYIVFMPESAELKESAEERRRFI